MFAVILMANITMNQNRTHTEKRMNFWRMGKSTNVINLINFFIMVLLFIFSFVKYPDTDCLIIVSKVLR